MAERRMFSKTIIDSDNFIDMPTSARLLYYDLGMRADDDGFVNSPKKIIKMTGASNDDLKILIAKQYIIPFESGIVVIKHWKIHNYIQKDRYHETEYTAEKLMLETTKNNTYELMDTNCIQDVYKMDTQVRLGKDRLGKDRVSSSRNEISEKVKYLNFYNENISLISPTTAERLNDYFNDFDSEYADEIICYAIEKAVENNVRKPKYIYAILDSWIKSGYKTLNDVKNEIKKSKFDREWTEEEIAEEAKRIFGDEYNG